MAITATKLTTSEADSRYSSLRERIVEHLFLGAILRLLWLQGAYSTEVSRAESDAFGYDVVIEHGRVVRHIQLKSKRERRPTRVSIARSLADKPGGCVICMILNSEMEIKKFYWFGAPPGKPLPSIETFKPSKRLRRDKAGKKPARSNHVDVPMGHFEEIADLSEIARRLFKS